MQKVNVLNRDIIFYQFDQDIGFWGKPNMERLVEYTGKQKVRYHVRHNRYGCRDPQYNARKLKDTIIFLGGSNTWGSAVEEENRFSNRLQKMTNRSCVNLGHNSLGLDQIGLALLTKVKKFSPSICIVEQYPWAVHRVANTYVNGYIKPYFYLEASGRLKLNKVSKFARFSFYRQIVGAYRNYLKELKEFNAGIDLSSKYDARYDPIFLLWKTFYYDRIYQLNESIIKFIRDYCLSKKIKLLFLVLPILQQFDDDSGTDLIDYNLPEKRFVDILKKCNVDYVNVVSRMISLHRKKQPVIQFDGHLNNYGHALVAESIYNKFKIKGWI